MSDHEPQSIDTLAHPRPAPWVWVVIAAGAGVFLWLLIRHLGLEEHHAVHHAEPPPLWGLGVMPFVLILGAIALLPLIRATSHWWESNSHRLLIAAICAILTLLYYALAVDPERIPTVLDHAIIAEYVPFIVLLFSLYVISGGIILRGDLEATPFTNTAFLAVGAGIASFVGTTGASMLLIRPLLKTNSERRHVVHTVCFFIILVSNVGGSLLPIGDPPLFLGYLRGVPFLWTLGLWPEWLFTCGLLLAIYYVMDVLAHKREAISSIQRDITHREPLRLQGWINFALLAGVVLAAALIDPSKPLPGTAWHPFIFLRESVMLALVGLSLWLTPRGVREENRFNYHAILEVAALFIGIFITMQVPVEVLNAMGSEFGLTRAWQFFWATGTLSSVLDNAPTYVVFFEVANAMTQGPGPHTLQLHGGAHISEPLLVGISLGAVFMGAMTYIGNGPNFMVKSIAEQAGVAMPSFFGYVARFSVPILIPTFALVSILFLRPVPDAIPDDAPVPHAIDEAAEVEPGH